MRLLATFAALLLSATVMAQEAPFFESPQQAIDDGFAYDYSLKSNKMPLGDVAFYYGEQIRLFDEKQPGLGLKRIQQEFQVDDETAGVIYNAILQTFLAHQQQELTRQQDAMCDGNKAAERSNGLGALMNQLHVIADAQRSLLIRDVIKAVPPKYRSDLMRGLTQKRRQLSRVRLDYAKVAEADGVVEMVKAIDRFCATR